MRLQCGRLLDNETYAWQKQWKNIAVFRVLMVQHEAADMVRVTILPIRVDIVRISVEACVLDVFREDNGSDLANEQKDALEAKHDFWRVSRSFTWRHYVLNRDFLPPEKNHFLQHRKTVLS